MTPPLPLQDRRTRGASREVSIPVCCERQQQSPGLRRAVPGEPNGAGADSLVSAELQIPQLRSDFVLKHTERNKFEILCNPK